MKIKSIFSKIFFKYKKIGYKNLKFLGKLEYTPKNLIME